MRIPSPDELLVQGAERLVAPLQERGTTLPALRAPLPFAQPLGTALVLSMILSLGGLETPAMSLAGILGVVGASDAFSAVAQSTVLARDARGWNPSVAARYRAAAVEARASGAFHRVSSAILLVVGFLLLGIAVSTGLPMAIVGGLGFVSWTGGRLAEACAACVLPRDPDLRFRAPAPAGA